MKRSVLLSIKWKFILAGLILSGPLIHAQGVVSGKTSGSGGWFLNPESYLIIGAVLLLLVVILVLAKTTTRLSKVVAKANMKGALQFTLFLLISTASMAQSGAGEAVKENRPPDWVFNPNVYLLGFLFIIMTASIYALYIANMKLIRALTHKVSQVEVQAEQTVAVVERKPSILRRIYLRMVDSVPVTQEKDIMLDHDYDGIKELDNNLPPWWKYGFYVTIIFGFFYLVIYHVSGSGKLQIAEYEEELAVAQHEKEVRLAASKDNVNEENVTILTDVEQVSKGKEIYSKLCVACHLADGGGQVGPNLTDAYWLHGGGIKNIFKTITYGVPNKGMISWQSQLSPKQIQQVSSYILTFNGIKPLVAKEPQGDLWVEENINNGDTLSGSAPDSSSVVSAEILKK